MPKVMIDIPNSTTTRPISRFSRKTAILSPLARLGTAPSRLALVRLVGQREFVEAGGPVVVDRVRLVALDAGADDFDLAGVSDEEGRHFVDQDLLRLSEHAAAGGL